MPHSNYSECDWEALAEAINLPVCYCFPTAQWHVAVVRGADAQPADYCDSLKHLLSCSGAKDALPRTYI